MDPPDTQFSAPPVTQSSAPAISVPSLLEITKFNSQFLTSPVDQRASTEHMARGTSMPIEWAEALRFGAEDLLHLYWANLQARKVGDWSVKSQRIKLKTVVEKMEKEEGSINWNTISNMMGIFDQDDCEEAFKKIMRGEDGFGV